MADSEATARIVALVMTKLGLEGRGAPGRLAEAIGMPPYSEGSVSLVRRWLRGQHAPSGEYLLEMLGRAGLLTAEADAAWRGQESPAEAEARAAAAAAAEAEDRARQLSGEETTRRARGTG